MVKHRQHSWNDEPTKTSRAVTMPRTRIDQRLLSEGFFGVTGHFFQTHFTT